MSALIADAVVVERPDGFNFKVTSPDYRDVLRRLTKTWGLGTELRLRIEPIADTIEKGARAHYFGSVVRPYAEACGLDLHEAHSLLKAACPLPGGAVSITQLDAAAFHDFVQRAAGQARAWAPEAFLLEER